MTDAITKPNDPIPFWWARAVLAGHNWTDGAYGFGGPDVAEAFGTPDQIGAALTIFLNSLGWLEVRAARYEHGSFAIRLEIEPHTGNTTTAADQCNEATNEDRIPLWEASASAGNAEGVFDAAYAFGNPQGDEGHMLGTAQEIGGELARVLKGLTHDDVETMKYGTNRFYLQLTVELPRQE
jgi:hypothetical protein